MRGADEQTGALFSYVSPEALVPRDHPLRPIRLLVNKALEQLSPEFEALYAHGGRTSIAPEEPLRALLLQAFYGVRSERQLMEQVTYNMLFRWFVGLSMDAPVWDVTVFTKNRERLLAGDVAVSFLLAVGLTCRRRSARFKYRCAIVSYKEDWDKVAQFNKNTPDPDIEGGNAARPSMVRLTQSWPSTEATHRAYP